MEHERAATTAASIVDDAGEAIRSLNHLTLGATLPAPEVYEILGKVKFAGDRFCQDLI